MTQNSLPASEGDYFHSVAQNCFLSQDPKLTWTVCVRSKCPVGGQLGSHRALYRIGINQLTADKEPAKNLHTEVWLVVISNLSLLLLQAM